MLHACYGKSLFLLAMIIDNTNLCFFIFIGILLHGRLSLFDAVFNELINKTNIVYLCGINYIVRK